MSGRVATAEAMKMVVKRISLNNRLHNYQYSSTVSCSDSPFDRSGALASRSFLDEPSCGNDANDRQEAQNA